MALLQEQRQQLLLLYAVVFLYAVCFMSQVGASRVLPGRRLVLQDDPPHVWQRVAPCRTPCISRGAALRCAALHCAALHCAALHVARRRCCRTK